MELGPIQRAWIKELREHPERQMKEALGRVGPDGKTFYACCLGQGLVCLRGLENVVVDGRIVDTHPTGTVFGPGSDENLPTFSYGELGLRSPSGHIDNTGPFKFDDVAQALTDINDHNGNTWADIADLMEEHPEWIFTKSV